jgi:hypothetical protein
MGETLFAAEDPARVCGSKAPENLSRNVPAWTPPRQPAWRPALHFQRTQGWEKLG